MTDEGSLARIDRPQGNLHAKRDAALDEGDLHPVQFVVHRFYLTNHTLLHKFAAC
jgi:hypothetical protein